MALSERLSRYCTRDKQKLPSSFFHNSRLIRRIQENKIYKKNQRLDQGLNTDHVTSCQAP